MLNEKENKNPLTLSNYWRCQLIGWGTVSLYWAYTVFSRDDYGVFYTLLNYVLDASIGIVLTHGYRYYALKFKWSELGMRKLLLHLVPSIIVLAVLYMTVNNIKWHCYWIWIANKDYVLWRSLLYWDPILITGLRLMAIWLLAYHLYHYYKRELHTAKENAQLSIVAKQAQLDNLTAQLNPHFLFNSLNSIKSLIIENPNTARRAIDLLSDLLRSSLYEKEEQLISIKEELLLVNDYIELEKMRFEERLEVEISVDSSCEAEKIPPLSIQLLVENAIKHGIDKRKEGGKVNVSINRKGTMMQIFVVNPGKLEKEKSTGLGLDNLQKRMQIQYKGQAKFSMIEKTNAMVEVELLIPVGDHDKV